MALGEKLRQARREAGLSQRQLCGERITRNMLSQIENGSATPSVDTLCFLAESLGRPVSWFLEEPEEQLANRRRMELARRYIDAGEAVSALAALEGWVSPDTVYDPEKLLVEEMALLAMAEAAIQESRFPYAGELLGKAAALEENSPHGHLLTRRRILAEGGVPGADLAALTSALPNMDKELLLRAKAAEDPEREIALLEAVQEQSSPEWLFLRGRAAAEQKDYQTAVCYLRKISNYRGSEEILGLLENCYQALGDYQNAYEILKLRK